MRYYDLTDDVHIPTRWHLGEITQRDGTCPRLRIGVPFCDGPLTAELQQPGKALPFSLSSFAVPVVRHSIAKAMESAVADGDLQRIPIAIPGHDGYEVVNVLRVVKCLDEDHSTYLKWTKEDHRADLAGQYRMVTKLSLDLRSIPADAHVFRVDSWLIALIVSEHAREAMEAVGCFGAKFSRVA